VWAACGICCTWILAILLVNPLGEFPLNDDWAYALPVKELIEHGHLRFTDWQQMSLISQVGYGTLFCWPFGFSFTALRLSTLLLGLAGAIAFYAVLRRIGLNAFISFVLSQVLLANPVYFELSHTFMTDVPFTSVALLSLLLSYHALRTRRSLFLALGTLCALWAALDRQMGIFLLLGPLIASLLTYGLGRKWLLWGVLPFATVAISLFIYEYTVSRTIGLPALYADARDSVYCGLDDLAHLRMAAIGKTLKILNFSGLYLGLFLLPFVLLVAEQVASALPAASRRMAIVLSLLIAVSQFAACVVTEEFLPWKNILVDFGLGPIRQALHGHTEPNAPRWVWSAITAVASLSSGMLLSMLILGWRRSFPWPSRKLMTARRLVFLVFVVPGLAYLGILLIAKIFFDRYLLFLLLPFLVLALQAVPGGIYNRISARAMVYPLVLLVVFLSFSTAGTHDYLAWNRARWQAVQWLQDNAVCARDCDGGFEVNSYLDGQQNIGKIGVSAVFQRVDARYLIAVGPFPEYKTIQSFPCSSWLPFGIKEILLLERKGAPLAGSPS
jgi:hypothetical protein